MEQTATIGEKYSDRWATFYVYEESGRTFACACQVIMDTLMNDEEKMNDIRTRKDRYAFDKNKIVELLSRARKKKRMKDVMERSLQHDGFESDVFMIDAEVTAINGTSVLMLLKAVTNQGIDCWQYFERDEFNKRFKTKSDEQARTHTATEGGDGQ